MGKGGTPSNFGTDPNQGADLEIIFFYIVRSGFFLEHFHWFPRIVPYIFRRLVSISVYLVQPDFTRTFGL